MTQTFNNEGKELLNKFRINSSPLCSLLAIHGAMDSKIRKEKFARKSTQHGSLSVLVLSKLSLCSREVLWIGSLDDKAKKWSLCSFCSSISLLPFLLVFLLWNIWQRCFTKIIVPTFKFMAKLWIMILQVILQSQGLLFVDASFPSTKTSNIFLSRFKMLAVF